MAASRPQRRRRLQPGTDRRVSPGPGRLCLRPRPPGPGSLGSDGPSLGLRGGSDLQARARLFLLLIYECLLFTAVNERGAALAFAELAAWLLKNNNSTQEPVPKRHGGVGVRHSQEGRSAGQRGWRPEGHGEGNEIQGRLRLGPPRHALGKAGGVWLEVGQLTAGPGPGHLAQGPLQGWQEAGGCSGDNAV